MKGLLVEFRRQVLNQVCQISNLRLEVGTVGWCKFAGRLAQAGGGACVSYLRCEFIVWSCPIDH